MQALVLLIAMCLFGFSIEWGGDGSSGDRIQSTLIPIWPPFLYSFVCSQISLCCLDLKGGAYYCYCAYVLRISRYSDFLSPMLTNTRKFWRGLKLSGESRS